MMMRSTPAFVAVTTLALVSLALLGASCDDAEDDSGILAQCDDRDPSLNYANFGEGFMAKHCVGCHSSIQPADLREGAPVGIDLNTYADVITWAERIEARAVDPDAGMPPGGGPSEEERALLNEWLYCGVYPDVEALNAGN